jgi:hypothetical protein
MGWFLAGALHFIQGFKIHIQCLNCGVILVTYGAKSEYSGGIGEFMGGVA